MIIIKNNTKTFVESNNYGYLNTYDKEQICSSKYKCPMCDGYGYIQYGSPEGDSIGRCKDCHGTGKRQIRISVDEYEMLKLK